MADGKGCKCAAYGECECACGADWTPQEIYDLRAKNTRLKEELAKAQEKAALADSMRERIPEMLEELQSLRQQQSEPVAWFHIPWDQSRYLPMASTRKREEVSFYKEGLPLYLATPAQSLRIIDSEEKASEYIEHLLGEIIDTAAMWPTAKTDKRFWDIAGIYAPPAQSEPDIPTWSHPQNWKGVDGAVAFHLIDRHADGWSEIGQMMNEWLAANQPAQSESCVACEDSPKGENNPCAVCGKQSESERDAARYRWLRDQHDQQMPIASVVWKKGSIPQSAMWCNLINADDLDKHIDAAMQEGKK